MKRLSRNVLALAMSDVVRRVLGFLTIAYLARRIGVSGFGVVNIGFTVLSYGMVLSSAGLGIFGTREVSRGVNGALVGRVLTLRLLLGLVVAIIAAAVAILFVKDGAVASIILIFSSSIIITGLFLDWYFQGLERLGSVGLARMVGAAVYLLLVLFLVRSLNDLLWVAVAAVLSDVATVAVFLFAYRTVGGHNLQWSWHSVKDLFRKSLPLGVGSILASVTVTVAPLALGIIRSNADVGFFSAASKLVMFLLVIDRVLGTLLLPATTRFQRISGEILSTNLSLALKWLMVFGLPVSVGGTLLAGKIVPFVYGTGYDAAIPVFQILIWFFFFTLLNTIFSSGLIAVGQERSFLIGMSLGAAMTLIAVVAGTFFWGPTGAAAGMVLTEVFIVLFMREKFRRAASIRRPTGFFQILLGGVAMGILLAILPPLHVILLIAIGGAFYIGIIFLLKGISIADVQDLVRRFA